MDNERVDIRDLQVFQCSLKIKSNVLWSVVWIPKFSLEIFNLKITGVFLNLNEQLFPFDDTLAKELLQRFPNNVFVIIVICTVN